jgi:putative DNA primase/helicase
MTILTHIFPSGFTAPEPLPALAPEHQLRVAMSDAGIAPPDTIIFDGKLHRFATGARPKDKSGWYIAHEGKVPAGAFGDWKQGSTITWVADIGRELSTIESMQHAAHMREVREQAARELAESREIAALRAADIWHNAQPASDEHPYIQRKGIRNPGWRLAPDGRLISPVLVDSEIVSLQYIDATGEKMFMKGGRTAGGWWLVGDAKDAKRIYVAEGVATAASIHEATGKPVAVAYNAGNIAATCQALRDYSAMFEIVVVADNDAHGVGEAKAKAAADAVQGVSYVVCQGHKDANDMAQAGEYLAAWLEPPASVADAWLIPADDFCAQPAPISWLIKRWVQNQALVMVHGPSGGGKTFVVLDWCLRMAAGVPDWMGNRVSQGNVVYLAGEGHHGLRSRVAAWKQHHQAGKLSMWLSKSGCDLNTASGYLKVAGQIRAMQITPSLIVVDTLHRFLSGDENSAQDAKTMLDACGMLMREFHCSVLLVHHTGVSDDAQARARGSSAWRGALDIEVSIVPAKDGKPMEIIQRKSKDAELAQPLYARLESVPVSGWLDEDGEQVTSAIVEQIEASAAVPDDATSKARALFEKAWFSTFCETHQGAPYVSRSGLCNYLATQGGMRQNHAEDAIKPTGKVAGALLDSAMIQPAKEGFIVVDNLWISAMGVLQRGKP